MNTVGTSRPGRTSFEGGLLDRNWPNEPGKGAQGICTAGLSDVTCPTRGLNPRTIPLLGPVKPDPMPQIDGGNWPPPPGRPLLWGAPGKWGEATIEPPQLCSRSLRHSTSGVL